MNANYIIKKKMNINRKRCAVARRTFFLYLASEKRFVDFYYKIRNNIWGIDIEI